MTAIYFSWQKLWLLGQYSNEAFGKKKKSLKRRQCWVFFRPSDIQLLQAQMGHSFMES